MALAASQPGRTGSDDFFRSATKLGSSGVVEMGAMKDTPH
jgi:hypothetical protein